MFENSFEKIQIKMEVGKIKLKKVECNERA